MRNHEVTDGIVVIIWAVVMGLFVFMVLGLICAYDAFAQTDSIEAQWTHGGEPDLAAFLLYWSEEGGIYALGYQLPIADYVAPPGWIRIPVSLPPGDYLFIVTGRDIAGNESDSSNVAVLHVQDVIKPSPCQGLKMRVPVP